MSQGVNVWRCISDCTHFMPALVLIQKQLRYLYLLLSHHHSATSSCVWPCNTEHLSQHKLWSKGIWVPDFIHHMYQLRFVLSDCWTSNNNWWQTTNRVVVTRIIDTYPCSCGKMAACQVTKIWPHLKNIVSIYPSCWVIDNIAISLRWWPFWKWRHIGSPFQFGDCGIHCSCWYRSQWQLIRLYTFLVCVGGVHWAHGPNDVISADFKDSQFEFQVSQ